MSGRGWIGVDLDGTLAHYEGWQGVDHIGEPIEPMVDRVREWVADGREVRIFTARVSGAENADGSVEGYIAAWCKEHLGFVLPITNVKDYGMVELWDDRAITVEQNTGRAIGREQPRFSP